MRSEPYLAAGLALLVLALCPADRAGAQQPGLKREVPPPEAGGCATAAPSGTAPAAVAQDPAEAARMASSAREAALLGDTRAARDLLAGAAGIDTSAADIAFLYARTLEELGEIDGAVREYCRYMELAADAPDAEEVSQRIGRIARPVRPGIPDSAVSHFHAALAFADAGQFADSEAAFSLVIASAPGWAAPYYNRALLRMRSNRRAEARADLEQFLALEPLGPDDRHVRDWIAQLATPFRSYSPGAAFAVGLIPGGGHFYTGRPVVGTTLALVAGGAVAFGTLYEQVHIDCLSIPDNNICPPDQVRGNRTERPYLLPAAAVAAAATLVGAVDAALGARRHNARAAVVTVGRLGSAVQVRPSRVDVAFLRLSF